MHAYLPIILTWVHLDSVETLLKVAGSIYGIGFVMTACTYVCDMRLQINAVLLTISLGSLAKSQLGRTSEIKSEMNERRKEFLELGK